MDAYNRGYNEAINGLSSVVGTKIGNATIVSDSSVLGAGVDVGAGFYGVAYNLNGTNVIAYRGTDALLSLPDNPIGSDVWNGYGLGAGSARSRQLALALQFYQAVAGAGVDPRWTTIELTGHSLGGGVTGMLCGRVG